MSSTRVADCAPTCGVINTFGSSHSLLSAGSGSSSVTSANDVDEQFGNVLVIAVAGDYNIRSHFERVIVSQIRQTGASASAWYSVIGGNKPVTKEDVIAAIDDGGFDAGRPGIPGSSYRIHRPIGWKSA